MKQKKKIVYAATFVLFLIVGFFVARHLKSNKVAQPDSVKVPAAPFVNNPTPEKKDFSYTATFVRRETHKGKVRGMKNDTVMDVTYETRYTGYTLDGDTTEKHVETRMVSKAIVKIVKEEPKTQVDGPVPVEKEMTIGQFSAMLKSLDENLVGRGIVINAVKLNDGDKNVRNITDVHEKIETKTWRSVKVVSLQYNETTGKVTSAIVEPIYP